MTGFAPTAAIIDKPCWEPSGPLLIPGLPDDLRVMPGPSGPKKGAQEGDEWRAQYATWRAKVGRYREAVRTRVLADPTEWDREREMCTRFGPKYFATMWLSVWEPREGEPWGKGFVPAILYPHQVWILDFSAERRSDPARLAGVGSKPRKVGATWAFLFEDFWGWLFSDAWDVGLVSRVADLVDKLGAKGTLFHKIDMMLADTPNFLLPKEFADYNPIKRRRPWRTDLNLTNPSNGNSIAGFTTTVSATRGDRLTKVDIDEGSFIPGLYLTYGSALGASNCVLVWSSESRQEGVDFETIREETRKRNPRAVLEIDSRDHPVQDQLWHENEHARQATAGAPGLATYEREIGRVAAAGFGDPIYPEAIDVPITGLPINEQRVVLRSHDPGRDGTYAVTLWQARDGGWVDLVGAWMPADDHDAEFIASVLCGTPLSGKGFNYTDRDLEFAAVMAGLTRIRDYGDPYGDAKDAGPGWYREVDKHIVKLTEGRMRFDCRTKPIKVEGMPGPNIRRLPTRREAFKALLRRTRCYNHPWALDALRAFREYHYHFRSHNRPTIADNWEADHDWSSHYAQSGEWLAVHLMQQEAISDVATAQMRQPRYANPHGGNPGPTMPSMPSMGKMPSVKPVA